MNSRFSLTYLISVLLTLCLPVLVICQSSDSIRYVLNHDLAKDDAEKFDLLCTLAANATDPDSVIKYSELAIAHAEASGINPSRAYIYKGFVNLNSGELAAALESFMTAAEYYESEKDYTGLAGTYTYIAETYNQQDNFDNAKLYLEKAVDIFSGEKDTINLAISLHNLGYLNYSMGQYDSALVLYEETIDLYRELDDLTNYGYSLGNAGLVYAKQMKLEQAEEYLLRAIEILSDQGEPGSERPVTEFMIEYAGILQHKGETRKAIATATESFALASKNHFLEFERDAAYRLSRLFEISGKYDSAFRYQSIYISANDSINSVQNIQQMADLRTEFEVARKQAEVEVLEKDKLIQVIVIIGLAVILLLAIGLIGMYSYNLRRTKKLMEALDERNKLLEIQGRELKFQHEELKQQHKEIEAQHKLAIEQKNQIELHSKAITDSIIYAQRIQSAILPPESYVTELLHENFIFNRPRDIVSGDFYWIKQVKGKIIVVAADCTGHGVPGAFMSLLGISYLNEIVQRCEEIQANLILNELRSQVKHSLRQHGLQNEPKDGLDVALCVLDIKTKMMQYSGAFNPLFLIRDVNGTPELLEIKANGMPVGFYPGKDKSFTNHEIQLEMSDTFYIFSDGFVDQFGGKDNKKFKMKNFKELLLDIHALPMHEQKEILEKTLMEWMGDQEQTDDILVIGVRI